MLHEYSVWNYPQFHVTTVGLGMYDPQIQGHTCIAISLLLDEKDGEACFNTGLCIYSLCVLYISGLHNPAIKCSVAISILVYS
jgi:hypothetical protein